jgi:hypothetical protein
MRGLKAICSFPTVLGFWRMTFWHCAGHLKSKTSEVFIGMQFCPSNPHWLLAAQNVDVQVMTDSAGTRKDWAREKKASPMIYPMAKMQKIQGAVNGRVTLTTVFSMGMEIECPRDFM